MCVYIYFNMVYCVYIYILILLKDTQTVGLFSTPLPLLAFMYGSSNENDFFRGNSVFIPLKAHV